MARNRKKPSKPNTYDKSTSSKSERRASERGKNAGAVKTSDQSEKVTSETTEAPTATGDDPTAGLKSPNARSGNDPEWYSKDNQLVIDSGSLPYSEPLGDPIKFTDKDVIFNYGSNYKIGVSEKRAVAISGILTAKTKSSFGVCDNIRSPLNVAANMLYTHVRYMNSGRKNYDPADLMIYVGTFADIYSYLVWMQRIYAKAFVYSQRNKYIGDMLLRSENINPDDIKANLANMRLWINTYINKLSSYAIPSELSYFARRVWIYSNIYLENPDGNLKDQMYQFSPDGFYQYMLDSNGAGQLQYLKLSEINPPSEGGYTWNELRWIGETLMSGIVGDEDFGLISGDVMKAFDGKIIGLNPLPEAVEIVPVYSEYVLEQFRNMDLNSTIIRGHAADGTTLKLGNVWQDPATGLLHAYEGYVEVPSVWGDQAEANAIAMNSYKMLTLKNPMPSPIDNMEISRLSVRKHFVKDGYAILSCGADIAVGLTVSYVNSNYVYSTFDLIQNCVTTGTLSLLNYAKLSVFKYAPILLIYSLDGRDSHDQGNITQTQFIGNVDNFTIIDENTLDKMHSTAMLSLLSVPGVARLVNIAQ